MNTKLSLSFLYILLIFQEVEAKDIEGNMTTVSMSNPDPVIDVSTLSI